MIFNKNPLKCLLIACLAISIAFPLINIIWIYPTFSALQIRYIEDHAAQVTHHLRRMLNSNLSEKRQSAQFTKQVNTIRNDFNLLKIKLFSQSGETIYSTDEADIGKINTKDYFRNIVTKGQYFTKVVNKNTKSMEGEITTVDVVETCVPLMDDGTFLGAFEVYYDITDRKARLDSVVRYATFIPIGIVVLFFIVICLFLSQVNRSQALRRQAERELIAANQAKSESLADLEHSNAQLQSEIRDHQTTEAALRASETRYRALVEGSLQGISIVSMAGKRLFGNAKVVEIMGYDSLDDFMRADTKTNVAPHELERLRGYREAASRGQPSPSFYEYEGRRVDGAPFWIQRLVTPVNWDGEAALHSSIVDITERKHAEADRARLQRELLDSSRQAGMAEMATGVLHNVGNVLNSVNVSACLLVEQLNKSAMGRLTQATDLMRQHRETLGAFITEDERGKRLPDFLIQLSEKLGSEHDEFAQQLKFLMSTIDHIKEIVSVQQSYAKTSIVKEHISLADIATDALKTVDASLLNHHIKLVYEFEETPPVMADKHKVMQILVNLLSNAKDALKQTDIAEPRLTLRVSQPTPTHIAVEVEDNGEGIESAALTKIFAHGFTTKSDGHGFGLHSSALAAVEMGGSLSAHSEGPGCGATFRLELPLQAEGGVKDERF